ncbi:MAG: hypothetical protein NVS4B6_01640 [Mycobacterium sp.]
MSEVQAVGDNRQTERALAWVEEITGGRIVQKELMARWRSVWLLDVELPDGTVLPLMLRGYREPIGPDEASFRSRLHMEAQFLEMLQDTDVSVARYYGHEPQGGWFLMERVAGDPLLTKVRDPVRQSRLFRRYMEEQALLHRLDPASLQLPDALPVSETYEQGISLMLEEFRSSWLMWPEKQPEPLFTLCEWFLSQHPPRPVERFSVCTGDIGADQFLFDGDDYKVMFDLEMCYVGDPLQDIGLMRLRDMCYPIPDLPNHIRYWGQLMGRELDKESVCYWTVAGMVASPMYVYPLWVQPVPQMITNNTQVYAAIPIHRRGCAEALAEYYDIDLTRPACPEPVLNPTSKFHTWLAGQLAEVYVPQAQGDGVFTMKCTAAAARTTVLCDTIGPKINQANLDGLTAVLGERPTDVRAGLAQLQARIEEDPQRDLADVIRVLHAIESREEMLLEPMQTVCGFASGVPLQRMY